MNEKIAVLDFAGSKAGMDYYNSCLLNALEKKGVKGSLFSNHHSKEGDHFTCYKCFSEKTPRHLLFRISDLLGGTLNAFRINVFNRNKTLIIQFFSATYKEFAWYYLAKLLNLKIITIIHDVSAFAHKEKKWIRNYIFQNSHHLVVHNKYSADELTKLLCKENEKKIKIIRHGGFQEIVKQQPDRELARKLLKIGPDEKIIFFFGQIKKVKGLDVLLKALPFINKDVSLIIAGKPWKCDFEQYQQLIKELKLEDRVIKKTEHISDYERDLLFKASDIIIIPYQKVFQSGVLLMSMSYCLPAIVSDLEANLELIEHKNNGLVFECGNARSLANEVNTLFEDHELYDAIKENAYKTVTQKYSWEAIALEYLKLLN